jgi:ABC-type multidrug transport system ATPase subunit
LISVEGVRVRYGEIHVLRGVDLRVAAGERVALTGSNGAGKSTLLRSILGLADYRGAIRVAGHDVRRDGVRARTHIGYVPQVPSFPGALTGAEVVRLYQELRGVLADPVEALRRVGLETHRDKAVRSFSGGMIRRLALAIARIGEPPVWLLDEPTSHLDREGIRLVLEWLSAARDEGRTVLLTTHHLDGLANLVDRTVTIEDGLIVSDTAASSEPAPAAAAPAGTGEPRPALAWAEARP